MILLLGDSDTPDWYPFDSFSVVDDDIPWDWKIGKIEWHTGDVHDFGLPGDGGR
ncbi:hypothetical protein FHR84_000849 [Actinopolyspora biskrensis]|uniref:Uncharacterized protein n=1 Tax=Actinopolyspora biskrensis TaxID=1470178 RepID=A0A852YX79_9ACTN|nr:hypothetical protein [Actinopolyspora biskrensis]NYH77535.1 hypothetical protein [Actinopolyspora biskrensis]